MRKLSIIAFALETRKTMSKSFVHYATASVSNQQTIAGSCTSMLDTLPMLTKACP